MTVPLEDDPASGFLAPAGLVYAGMVGTEFDTAGFLTPDLVNEEFRTAVIFENEACYLAGSGRVSGRQAARRRALGKMGWNVVAVSMEQDRTLTKLAGRSSDQKITWLGAKLREAERRNAPAR